VASSCSCGHLEVVNAELLGFKGRLSRERYVLLEREVGSRRRMVVMVPLRLLVLQMMRLLVCVQI